VEEALADAGDGERKGKGTGGDEDTRLVEESDGCRDGLVVEGRARLGVEDEAALFKV